MSPAAGLSQGAMRTVIRGGTVVTPVGCFPADVLIEDGVIAGLGRGWSADVEVDAGGCLVLPGLVDPHVHMGLRTGEFTTSDDFATGSRAAAFGGVTTIIDFAAPEEDEPLDRALARRLAEAENRCQVDYDVHVAINRAWDSLPQEVQRCIELGARAFRLYTAYPGLRLDDGEIYTVLRLLKGKGALVRVHAENAAAVETMKAEFVREGATTPYHHYLSSPEFVEEEAVARLLLLQRESGCPIYFNHISTGVALRLIQQAKLEGQRAYAEVCPQYLFFTAEVYRREDGALYLASPAFKGERERLELWRGLERGMVDAVGTDHCSFTREQKMRYAGDFTRVPKGVPGVETTLPLLFTEWRRRGWPLEELVALTSYRPSRIFGLYPRKGAIQPGADADIVVFDPEEEWEIGADALHMNVDWSPYQGFKCTGKVKSVLLRGRVLVEDGRWKGRKPMGQRVTPVSPGGAGEWTGRDSQGGIVGPPVRGTKLGEFIWAG